MKNVGMPPYCKYTITDAIVRLENLRCSVGWGQLNEDLEAAINCMQYVADIIAAKEDELFENISFDDLNREIDSMLAKQSQGKD